MPNRVIRDSVLDSDRYVGLTHDSERLLFLELILMADDFGLVPMNFAFLRRRASPCAGKSEKQVTEMVEQLVERDLVRLYRSDSDSMFGFIPRFGNAPRAKKPKWPLPPEQPAFNEINDLARSCIANAGKCTASAPHLQTNAPETETETETHQSTSSSSTKGEAPRKRAAPKPKASKRCPQDFEPDSELIAWVLMDCPGVNWTRETASFKDWEFKTARSDWPATWRSWMRKAFDSMQQRRAAGPESFRAQDERIAAESVRRLTGGLAHNRAAVGEAQHRELLPFERGYVKPTTDTIDGDANVRRIR